MSLVRVHNNVNVSKLDLLQFCLDEKKKRSKLSSMSHRYNRYVMSDSYSNEKKINGNKSFAIPNISFRWTINFSTIIFEFIIDFWGHRIKLLCSKSQASNFEKFKSFIEQRCLWCAHTLWQNFAHISKWLRIYVHINKHTAWNRECGWWKVRWRGVWKNNLCTVRST